MISLEYMAGFFDGEGCINITLTGKCNQTKLRLMLSNTNEELMSLIQNQFGGKIRRQKHHAAWKTSIVIVWIDNPAEDFLRMIEPFLILKKPQALLALEFRAFMGLPKKQRCHPIKCSNPKWPNNVIYKRNQETIDRELKFKNLMHGLNSKGVVQ